MEFDTRTLLLAVHAFIALLVFAYAGLTLANGGTTAAGVRALMGTLVLALGVSLYRVRGKQE